MIRERAAKKAYDAVIVGSGPNGLSAALTLAQQGLSVLVVEAHAQPGGGLRSEAMTLPGFVHDVCSAIHPTARVSPFFKTLEAEAPLATWIEPPVALAHPLEDRPAAGLFRDFERTGETLDRDASAWRRLHAPLLCADPDLFADLLSPLRWPGRPFTMARFALSGLRSAIGLSKSRFAGEAARALFAGCAAHSVLPLDKLGTAAFGLVLSAAAHSVSWPFPRGGAQTLADALVERLQRLGGELMTGARVTHLDQLPPARAVLFDTSVGVMASIAGSELPPRYVRRLAKFRPGPGVFKLDWALSEAIPWKDPLVKQAATVHVGGSLSEIVASESSILGDRVHPRPFVLLVQTSLFDPTRAPAGRHTAWAYCHVPSGSPVDHGAAIEAQIERYAPGFRDVVLARVSRGPADIERDNTNYVQGDIGGGANDLGQLFARPVLARVPWATSNPRLFLCSASTPPGGGVHGMCGHRAARIVLARVFGR